APLRRPSSGRLVGGRVMAVLLCPECQVGRQHRADWLLKRCRRKSGLECTAMAFKFQGVDFIQFGSLLSNDELIVRASTRAFVEDNLIPIIEQCNRDGRFPRELVLPMGKLGFYGATLEGYGCAGVNNVQYGLLMQELERGDSGIRSFVSVQSALVMYPIYAFGSEQQKDYWLPKMA